MKYLLDTNTCIRYLNGSSENIRNQFEQHNYNEIVLCSIVKAELFYGVLKSANPDKNLVRINEFFPDLIVYSDNEFFFSEVKSAKDTISKSQIKWFHYLSDELCIKVELFLINYTEKKIANILKKLSNRF
ncbi:MAG: PIN domain-containing protein [Candidatus Cloacimonetes bacterium]|nr:PIN domain-containing protein [Candidatus Cloacimonadota bacterium]